MTFADALCLVTGVLWGYFSFPVFIFARIMADMVAEGRLQEGLRWKNQSLLWKVTVILGHASVYLSYVAVGAVFLNGYGHRIEPLATIGGRLWALGFLAGLIVYGSLSTRSTWKRRKRRAS